MFCVAGRWVVIVRIVGAWVAGVETERGEDVGEAGEHLPGGRDVLHQQGLQHHVRQTFVLKTGQQRGLLDTTSSDKIGHKP